MTFSTPQQDEPPQRKDLFASEIKVALADLALKHKPAASTIFHL